MENFPGYFIIFLLAATVVGLLACGLYHLVKSAVKRALREYDEEKRSRT